MFHFPQLSSGAMVQHPLTRGMHLRTLENRLLDGTVRVFRDEAEKAVSWRLQLRGLSSQERGAIEALHNAVAGRLRAFLFLDPLDNLLRFSEGLSSPVWQAHPGIVMAGETPPTGLTNAFRLENQGAVGASVTQLVEAPPLFHYTFSAFVRGAGSVRLVMGSTEGEVMLKSTWSRVSLSSASNGSGSSFPVGLMIAPGGDVSVTGLQLDAQPGTSPYKSTQSRAGIYPKTHFMDDELTFTTDGPGDHATTLSLLSRYYA